MSDLYSTGQPIRLSTVVQDIAAAAADPTTLVLTYGLQGGTVTTKMWPTPADITRDSLGHFHYDIPALAAAGHYRYAWTATGTAAGQRADVFDVFAPAAYPRLVSLADAKAFLKLTGAVDDALLDRMIGWASARILREIQATVATVTERRRVDGYRFTVAAVPVVAVTAVAAVGATSASVDVSALVVESAGAGLICSYPTYMCGLYDVTFTAGFSDGIPAGVDGATLTLIRHWWNQSQAHGSATYGDAGFVPDFKGLPNAVLNMLASAPPQPPMMA